MKGYTMPHRAPVAAECKPWSGLKKFGQAGGERQGRLTHPARLFGGSRSAIRFSNSSECVRFGQILILTRFASNHNVPSG